MTVSVVIPTYNRRHVIGQAVDSVLQQSVGDVEVIVVDDGSTDGTAGWLADRYAGRSVRVLPNAGLKGPAGGRNTGMRAARGDFIALLDSDDSFLPGHLAAALAAFEQEPTLDVVFGRARYERNGVPEDYMGPNFERKLALARRQTRDDGLVLFDEGFFEHLLRHGCWFNLSSVVLRRRCVGSGMNESLRISEDYEFWVRLSRHHRFGCLPGEQIRYTLHDDNISFEAAGSTADHAPRLLQALDAMRAYDGLTRAQRHLIDEQAAGILFDWAYRCRLGRRFTEAAGLHWRSLRHGLRARNLWALAKLPAQALRPR